MSQNGKGSARRKALVPERQVEDNWKKTFGKSKKEKKDVEKSSRPTESDTRK